MAKRKVKNRRSSERWKAYKVTGEKIERIKKTCMKCGEGYFMGEHKDRWYCGKCHYVIMKGKEAKA